MTLFRCVRCGAAYDSHTELMAHIRAPQWQTTLRNRQRTLRDVLDPRDVYRCTRCGRAFTHREELDRHRWLEHRPRRAAG